MFGFGDSKERAEEERRKKQEADERADWEVYIPSAILRTFGTNNPQKINKIWREYMPEITEAILETEHQTIRRGTEHLDISNQIDEKHDEMMKKSNEMLIRLDSLEKQNKELQERVNTLVDLLTRQVEKENGRGR